MWHLSSSVCDILICRHSWCPLTNFYYSATEPTILVLIVIQTILLSIDAAPSVYEDPRAKNWGTSNIDYAMLILFIIYT